MPRRSMHAACATLALGCAVVVAACGAGEDLPSSTPDGEYPLVTLPEPERQAPVTTPGGAVVQYAVPPTERTLEPSPTCERMLVTYHDGSKPTKRPEVFPPAPGLRARALSPRRIRLEWSFRTLPDDCRPATVWLGITATTSTPTHVTAGVNALEGSAEIEYPDFLPPPETALAGSYTSSGRRSRVVKVAIDR